MCTSCHMPLAVTFCLDFLFFCFSFFAFSALTAACAFSCSSSSAVTDRGLMQALYKKATLYRALQLFGRPACFTYDQVASHFCRVSVCVTQICSARQHACNGVQEFCDKCCVYACLLADLWLHKLVRLESLFSIATNFSRWQCHPAAAL